MTLGCPGSVEVALSLLTTAIRVRSPLSAEIVCEKGMAVARSDTWVFSEYFGFLPHNNPLTPTAVHYKDSIGNKLFELYGLSLVYTYDLCIY